ncbi:MAG TPA: chromate resistance protein ChrB domain-containing protein [Methyloversatilis sp.]
MKQWIALIISLPTSNAATRMRAWRALKAAGAAVLRDGVYLLPERDDNRTVFKSLQAEVRAGGGTACLLRVEEPDEGGFAAMFDRSADYERLIADSAAVLAQLSATHVTEAFRQVRRLRKTFDSVSAIDFFPGEARRQADVALHDAGQAVARLMAPDEPGNADRSIVRQDIADYRGQTWATRRRPWADRLASAWLIRRFIDPEARFVWLDSPADCPAEALGFDFDGARFSHAGALVTFEVLLASFGLAQPALGRLGALVHYLDVGGAPPAEAAGVESVLAGLRDRLDSDDALLTAACAMFDGLLVTFEKGMPAP